MSDLISRSVLIKKCNELSAIEWNQKAAPVSWADAYEHFADETENAPAADAVEVGSCDGCCWKKIGRQQKCSCCRRNRDMKDCYRRVDDAGED